MVTMTTAGLTDTGMSRTNNEDTYLTDKSLLIVADGMGGAAAGEVASQLAVEEISKKLRGTVYVSDDQIRKAFNDAIWNADATIKERTRKNPDLRGMGTTIMAALHLGDRLLIGFVGDSRAYIVTQKNQDSPASSRPDVPKVDTNAATAILQKITDDFQPSSKEKGSIQRITNDHSVVMELVNSGVIQEDDIRTHPMRNRITRCVGNLTDKGPDFVWHTIANDDTLILCSDGLWEMIHEDLIFAIVKSSKTVEEMCKRLINAANDAGGADNITVITAQFKKQ
ncbi:protein phosphatase 2C domain-containing protein [bacterium]|nr:protein phosphatase 2C domain-containing protein [bacterium]